MTLREEQSRLDFWVAKALEWLMQHQIPVLTGVRNQAITDKGVRAMTRDGEEIHIEADTVVVVSAHHEDEQFFDRIDGNVPEIHWIEEDDSDELAYFGGAIHKGARAGMSV